MRTINKEEFGLSLGPSRQAALGRKQLLLALTMMALCLTAGAARIPFGDAELFYEFDGEPVQSFFEGFFAEQGLAVTFSSGASAMRGTLNGPRRGSPRQLFESLLSSNQMLHYFDGTVVHLYTPQEQTSRYLTVSRQQAAQFKRMFRDLDLGNEHNTAVATNNGGVIAVNGAPRFVEQVVQLVGALTVSAARPTPTAISSTLRYFPLRYAFASDTTIFVGRRQTVVPGVASLLREAVTGQGSLGLSVANTGSARGARRLRGQGLAQERPGRYPVPPGGQVDEPPLDYPLSAAPPADPDSPYIIADTMHNSILIRDKPARMGMYESLIEILDVEPALVEIVATVIDIDRKRLKKLGIDLRVRGTDAGLNFGDPEIAQSLINADTADNVDLIPALTGLTSSVVVGDSIRFAARLNALDDRDLVRVVSSPQIITLNDMEAVIESNREVFIPVGGTYEVDLFDVIAGTTLRVTPHVINDGGRRRIRISASVEDGEVQLVSSSVQRVELPVVDRNVVSTQAIIEHGQSLLVGGLRRTTDVRRENGVPVLRRVPLVKHLFNRSQKQRDSSERLFLITPRLVSTQEMLELKEHADEVQEEFEEELGEY